MSKTRGKLTIQFEKRIASVVAMLNERHLKVRAEFPYLQNPENQANAHRKIIAGIKEYIEKVEKQRMAGLRHNFKKRSLSIEAILVMIETNISPADFFGALSRYLEKLSRRSELRKILSKHIQQAQAEYHADGQAAQARAALAKSTEEKSSDQQMVQQTHLHFQRAQKLHDHFYNMIHPENPVDLGANIQFSPLKRAVFELCLCMLVHFSTEDYAQEIDLYADLFKQILACRFLSDDMFVESVRAELEEYKYSDFVGELFSILDNEELELNKRRASLVNYSRLTIGLLGTIATWANPPVGLTFTLIAGVVSLTDRYVYAAHEALEFYDSTCINMRAEVATAEGPKTEVHCPQVASSYHGFYNAKNRVAMRKVNKEEVVGEKHGQMVRRLN